MRVNYSQPIMQHTIARTGLVLAVTACLLSVAQLTAAPEKAKAKKKEATEQQLRPYINTMYPAGGQRGKVVEVVVTGTNLVSGTDALALSAVRVAGSRVTAGILSTTATSGVRVSFQVAPDADLGERDVRFVTPDGVSNRYRFTVGQLPELNEVEPNSNMNQAQRLASLPVLVNGQIQAGGDRDYFRFAAKAGQTLVCEVQARALVPYIADAVPGWFDPALTLYDASGRKLGSVDDYHLKPDPLLIYKVPKDGEYVLELEDIIFRGRGDFIYRLSIGELPFIAHVFPLGAQRGSTAQLELHGANLPEQTLKLPISTDPNTRRSVSVTRNGIVSNRVLIAVDDAPETMEVEPNDSMEKANRVQIPVAINGRIQKAGDFDYFVFAAQAKQQLILEVLARRLESPLDSVLTVYNSKGEELAENDDWVDPREPLMTHYADSRISYTFPAAGDYYVRIKDAQHKGGEDFAYRLMISPPQPDYALRLTPDNPSAGQGDTAVITATALRKDGFNGEIAVSVQGLPKGLMASDAVIPANQDEVRFTIAVPPDAPLGMYSPVVTGSATIASKPAIRRAVAAEAVMQAFASTHNVFTRELLFAITEPPPVIISTSNPPGQILELPQGGELQIPVKAFRQEGIRGSISIAAQKPPQGINAKGVQIPPEKDEAVLTLTANKQVPVGSRQNIIVTGVLKSGKLNVTSVAPAIPVKIVEEKK